MTEVDGLVLRHGDCGWGWYVFAPNAADDDWNMQVRLLLLMLYGYCNYYYIATVTNVT